MSSTSRSVAAETLFHPSFVPLILRMDRRSALFIFVNALLYLPLSIYSATYLRQYLSHYSLKSLGVLYNLIIA